MIDLHAIWNVLLFLLILYSPGLICGARFIKAAVKREKPRMVLMGILTVAFTAASSFILYTVVDFMLNF